MAAQIKKVPKDEIGEILQNYFLHPLCEELVLVGDEETCVPIYYEKFADAIDNFEVRDSDIFVCTYPKTGTTWAQEMVWLIKNNLNYEGAKAVLGTRFPFFELSILHDVEKANNALEGKSPEFARNSVKYVSGRNSPRFIKTHLPFAMLPKQIQNGTKSPKMIYVIRDPRDVCVSYYHHGTLLQGWRCSLEDFCKVFMSDKAVYGSFWKHVFGFWEKRDLPNILFITYEEMKNDLPSVVKRVASFLDTELTNSEIERLCKHLSFDSMKDNEAVNGEVYIRQRREKNLIPKEGKFMRSGTIGKHKEEISPEMNEKLNDWIKDNISGTSFVKAFSYIL